MLLSLPPFDNLCRGVAQIGEYVKLGDCLDIMDILYEKEETMVLYNSPCSLAASVLACASFLNTIMA